MRRDLRKQKRQSDRFQSTHPLRGATSALSWYSCANAFQSTHPLRGATSFTKKLIKRIRFQSTHPLRGATRDFDGAHARADISIHAPLAGCDATIFLPVYVQSRFQSTHPLRGATTGGSNFPVRKKVSIHAPLAGCDQSLQGIRSIFPISIHAPLAGCDSHSLRGSQMTSHFNPRTPCGVRQRICAEARNGHEFQSTHPLRGAT